MQPWSCSHCSSRATWLIPVTAPPVISASSASIFRCRRLRDPPRGFGKLAINTEPALVDPAAQRPERLFRRRQRRQPIEQLTFDFDILPTIVVEPAQTIIIIKPINAGRIFIPDAHAAALISDASGARQQHLCGLRARAHRPPCSTAPAIPAQMLRPSCSGAAPAEFPASHDAAP